MKRGVNKSNIDILKDYVAGIRPFITMGYNGDTNKYRLNGDKWTDAKGIKWEKKNGRCIKLSKTKGDLIRKLIEQRCECGQIIKWGTDRDQSFFNRTGLCENCVITYETNLRIMGIYPSYELYKVISYELGSVKDIKGQLIEAIKYLSNETGDVHMICNSEGFLERWKNTNQAEILSSAKADLKIANQKIKMLSKAMIDAKKVYVKSAKAVKLKCYV